MNMNMDMNINKNMNMNIQTYTYISIQFSFKFTFTWTWTWKKTWIWTIPCPFQLAVRAVHQSFQTACLNFSTTSFSFISLLFGLYRINFASLR